VSPSLLIALDLMTPARYLQKIVGKYESYVSSSKNWKKATGKDRKFYMHEQSQAD